MSEADRLAYAKGPLLEYATDSALSRPPHLRAIRTGCSRQFRTMREQADEGGNLVAAADQPVAPVAVPSGLTPNTPGTADPRGKR